MYLAIDLGGTKTLLGLFDETGELKKAVKFPTSQEYSTFIQELTDTLGEFIGETTLSGACMAIPGTVDRENGLIIRLGNLSWPKDTAIRADLMKIINCNVVLENDANLAGLSEATLVKDTYRKSLYITISTGIGGGYVVDGILEESTIDAEVGRMVFEKDGKYQDWESFASGSWIVRTYGKRASDLEDPEAWDQISKNIAIGIVNACNVLTPEIVIIGGGVGTHLHKFKDRLEAAIKTISPTMARIPPIAQAQRPEEAVIYGCYELAKQKSA